MFSLDLECALDNQEMLIAELWERGSSGIVELDNGRVRAFFDDDAQQTSLVGEFGGVPIPADERDWVAFAQERLQPMEVGKRFFLVPQWREDPTPPGRFRIEVNNGLAFGTGAHETTRLCIELLEKYVRRGMTVVDIGTGSGILAQAARLLGAGRVVACDIDPTAVEVAKSTGIPMFIGSAAAVRNAAADIVVANISPECLNEMASEWMRMLKPGGVAILSGIEASDRVNIAANETRCEGNWRALVVTKEKKRPERAGVLLMAAMLMPMPWKITPGTGEMTITRNFAVTVAGSCDARVAGAAERIKKQLVKQAGAAATSLTISCGAAGLPVQALEEDESYRLEVTPKEAKIAAPNSLGALRGLATFLQLGRTGAVPAVSIEDRPRFPWRGLHLDVSRHWMPMDVVERNLEAMWAVKLNVFHWHLSDNQGFRVESKRYPKLQEMGSDGLFYTQNQIRAVIAYARDRGIRVLPEFDIPGHSTAMLAGYPELGSAPGPFQIGRTWGIFDPVIDPTNEAVYRFLDGFIGEMAGLFPDSYFHIGGDEVNGTEWDRNPSIVAFKKAHAMRSNDDLQAYFNKRIQPVVTKYGKKMMGWDEILQPDLPKDIVIHSWRGQKSLTQAVAMGFKGVLSSGYYLDHMESAGQHYLVDPAPTANPGILGGEVCMWSEYVSAENVDSRIWPRTAAIAERFWSSAELRDLPAMYTRLAAVDGELDGLGSTHNSAYRRMLERLAGSGPVDALKVLADVVEPLPLGGRARAQPYTQQTPLNRLVDAARPDSAVARQFASKVEANDYSAVRAQLTAWRDNATRLDPMVRGSEMAPLSRDLTALGAMGLEALDMIESGRKPTPAWVAQQKASLAAIRKPRAEVRFAIVDAIGRLLSRVS